MTKPIKDWLAELPEPYRTKALAYLYNFGIPHQKVESLEMAIVCAFPWERTIEGCQFWEQLSGGKLPPLPPTVPPTNALEALHAIALKEDIKMELIEGITRWHDHPEPNVWQYALVGNDDWKTITFNT